MANLRSIKDRINSIKNTQKITRAMKMVAAAKVKKAESAVKSSRPFTFELYKMFSWIYKETHSDICDKLKTKEAIDNYSALLCEREIKTVGLVIISSNKGLAGAYCANIVRYSLNLIKQYLAEGKKVKVYLVGQKAQSAIKNAQKQLDFEIKQSYVNILDGINSSSAYIVANNLARDYVDETIDKIEVVTTKYKNMMSYQVQSWCLLPAIIEDKEIQKYENKELDEELKIENNSSHIEPLSEFLPDAKTLLSTIVPMYVTNVIYQALLEAQASELASRMTAMSSATNNAQDMISSLTIEYNKARQAKITQELTEVISGAGALKK
ncbi:MAG: ATP synthase F1 subunit gamma [Candidatus Gastranaerophilales bacterium]|nr:ATP synthase F1 subunit gamma [Candidatus Gastranaerophilales bacterium]